VARSDLRLALLVLIHTEHESGVAVAGDGLRKRIYVANDPGEIVREIGLIAGKRPTGG
jgi:hypothetical protein